MMRAYCRLSGPMVPRCRWTMLVVGATIVIAFSGRVCLAAAATPGPGWAVRSVALPSNFSPTHVARCEETVQEVCDEYLITVANVGTRASEGPIVVTDALPAGVVVRGIKAAEVHDPGLTFGESMACTAKSGESSFECTYANPVSSGSILAITVQVRVEPGVPRSVTNHVEVEGGGAAPAITAEPTTVSNTVDGSQPGFGLQDFSIGVYGPSGEKDTQAAAHPATVVTTIDYTTKQATELEYETTFSELVAVQEPKNTIVHLPLGIVGNPLSAGQCAESSLVGSEQNPARCPADSQVGS